jgi:hypothetical protein
MLQIQNNIHPKHKTYNESQAVDKQYTLQNCTHIIVTSFSIINNYVSNLIIKSIKNIT